MAKWHGYLGIENLNLDEVQRGILIDTLKVLGPYRESQPARRCHWRIRLDGGAAIFEALFDEDNLTVQMFKNRLGNIFGVNPDSVDTAVQNAAWGEQTTPVVTFSRNGTDYLRIALYGGAGAKWADSGDAARGYLAAYSAEWESEGLI